MALFDLLCWRCAQLCPQVRSGAINPVQVLFVLIYCLYRCVQDGEGRALPSVGGIDAADMGDMELEELERKKLELLKSLQMVDQDEEEQNQLVVRGGNRRVVVEDATEKDQITAVWNEILFPCYVHF